MISKKTLPVAAVLLLVAAALAAGASQIIGSQQPAGQVITMPGAPTDNGQDTRTIPQAPTLPAARGTVTLNDSFDTGKLAGWRELASAPGSWSIVDGHLEQWGDADRRPTDDQAVFVTDAGFADGTFEADLLSTSGEALGVVFRGSDNGYYRLEIAPALQNSAPKATLYKVSADGTAQKVAENTSWAGFQRGEWQQVRVDAAGAQITVSVSGTQLFTAQDSSFASGWVGVWAVADRGANFDNVRVQR